MQVAELSNWHPQETMTDARRTSFDLHEVGNEQDQAREGQHDDHSQDVHK